jgi:hypothetical protein
MMRSAYLLAAAFTAAFATQAWTQSPKVVMEEMMVPSEPGIEIYVRNKRPADMSAFRPERTLLFVHGATYPAHTSFDLKLDGLSWMDYIAARVTTSICSTCGATADLRVRGRWTKHPTPTHRSCAA